MAKVRLQARGSFEEEDHEEPNSGTELVNVKDVEEGLAASYAEVTRHGEEAAHLHSSPRPRKGQGSAIALLAKVLREDGFVGWYQVRCTKYSVSLSGHLIISLSPRA